MVQWPETITVLQQAITIQCSSTVGYHRSLHFEVVDSSDFELHLLDPASWYSIAAGDKPQQALLTFLVQFVEYFPEVPGRHKSRHQLYKLTSPHGVGALRYLIFWSLSW